jgi:SpoIID/LytB domain protein
MSVRLTRFDGAIMAAQQDRGHMTTNAAGHYYYALRAVHIGPQTFRVEGGPGCGGPWTVINPAMGAPVVFAPATQNDDRDEMIQACEPDGSRRWYRGDLRAIDDGGTSRVINHLFTEDYLKGVVPRESPASWGDLGGGAGMAALRAQSVAARSYALSENRYGYAKTCDTTACQVYGGRAVIQGGTYRDLEDSRTDRAIGETAFQVRERNGAVARTEFSSSTGGWTAGGTFPPVSDEGDSTSLNPNHNWRTSIPVESIQGAWPNIGVFRSLTITRRNGFGDWGGRVLDMRVDGSAGSIDVSGATFRTRLGLKSDWFRLAEEPNPNVVSIHRFAGGGPPNPACPAVTDSFLSYPQGFRGGAYVASGDLDGDGCDEIVTGAGGSGGSHVRVFRANGTPIGDLFAFPDGFYGGVRVAVGNVDDDPKEELVTAAGPSGGSHVRIWEKSATGFVEQSGFFAYPDGFYGGVFVAVGDVTGDGRSEIVTGAGESGGAHVRVFSQWGEDVGGFFAYPNGFYGGVRVAVADVTGDNAGDIVTGAGPSGGPHVRIFDARGNDIGGFFAYPDGFYGGVFVAGGPVIPGDKSEVVTGAGETGGPHVRVLNADGTERVGVFSGGLDGFTGGVRVAVGDLDGDGIGEVVTTLGPPN